MEMAGPLQFQPIPFQNTLQWPHDQQRSKPLSRGRQQGEMLMQFRVSPKTLGEYSAEEWQARVDLAAAHRLAFNQGFSEGIFNHLTLVVPGRSDRYYQIPFGMHWSEVTASSFMEVGIDDGKVKRGNGEVERSCYCIHAPIHKALPQARAVFHTHMPYASALTRLEDPRIKEIGQTEVGMSGKIAYDDEYTGPGAAPLRCPEAHPRPQGTGLRVVKIGRSITRYFGIGGEPPLPLWERVG